MTLDEILDYWAPSERDRREMRAAIIAWREAEVQARCARYGEIVREACKVYIRHWGCEDFLRNEQGERTNVPMPLPPVPPAEVKP